MNRTDRHMVIFHIAVYGMLACVFLATVFGD